MGKVYLVGAGPGDPELITLKGLKAIQQSDIILYDRLVNEELLGYASKNAELIYCGKSPEHHSLTQDNINKLLCAYAKEDKIVTRLKGGDPFIFGRGGEEAMVLRENGLIFEIIPGITSGSAAPTYAGIPLTHRDYSSSVSFVSGVSKTGEEHERYWEHLAKSSDTLCIYMGVKSLPEICERLIRYGRHSTTPIAVIHWGTTEMQQTVTGTLEDITHVTEKLKNPSMIIIGEVVRLRDEIQWFNEETIEHFNPEVVIG
ncbi:uroporphyrinogen-III C-methyltransferase [Oceanobacillus iheyensis]|uniref:Uroporphyrinogen-III C-methyltransferase n=1 Tax=Oceanobacillus iheyensis (strain DSM 14371 / CIP 107618 / JCM 11309 / KCTC 3954 / HTE831) TaxID=221109 RepID=Q8EQN9_OCEIH|nr:uroporphyrinogen-III C-methyltransferase [Oceanobacillus iheyensis]BAC13611.1 uroporphyrin-III C-methyltransferase [Oceanobacillus iheyensis HTE831]